MVKIDLITGFLGSGKTTFLRKYATYLMEQGNNIGILENDYGAVNVDMMLLQDLAGDNCELEMVAGGCHYDCHKRRFKTKLISMGMCGYDRVLVEPSGIYDTDEFFDVLQEEPLDRWYQIGNVIVIVDATMEEELSQQSEYLLASQLAKAGVIVFSHAEGISIGEKEQLLVRLNDILQRFQCKKVLTMDMVQEEDYAKILQSGYTNDYYKKYWYSEEEGFTSLYYLDFDMSVEDLEKKMEQVFAHPESYGNVFRIKGFLKQEDTWVEINASKDAKKIETIREGQKVLIMIGENLNQEELEKVFGEGCL